MIQTVESRVLTLDKSKWTTCRHSKSRHRRGLRQTQLLSRLSRPSKQLLINQMETDKLHLIQIWLQSIVNSIYTNTLRKQLNNWPVKTLSNLYLTNMWLIRNLKIKRIDILKIKCSSTWRMVNRQKMSFARLIAQSRTWTTTLLASG